MSKKIICLSIIIFLIFSSLSTATFAFAVEPVNPPRTWLPGLEVTSIHINNTTFEPSEDREFRNNTHEVLVTVTNTGGMVLKDIIMRYSVKRGTFTIKQGMDNSIPKLNISESHTYSFQWKPVVGNGESYTVTANATADSFGVNIGPNSLQETFIIRDVKFDVAPVNFALDYDLGITMINFANKTHSVQAVIKNAGNFDLTTSFTVSGTIYTFPAGPQLWSDQATVSGTIKASKIKTVGFTKPWTPPSADLFILNLSTSLSGDSKPANDNFSFPVGIMDMVDAGIIEFIDHQNGGKYANIPFSIRARLANQGNLNITTDFLAQLEINDYPSGNNLFSPTPVQVTPATPNNVSKPGTNTIITFSLWTYANGLRPGWVWVNVTINPQESNGSVDNNKRTIMIQLVNQTQAKLNCLAPKPGVHYPEDINKVTAQVTNSGTVDIGPYYLNLTIENTNVPGEVWPNHVKTPTQTALLTGTSAVVQVLTGWDFAFNAKFSLNITMYTTTSTKYPLAWATRTFEIAGGVPNGTINGKVTDFAQGLALEGIVVSLRTANTPPQLISSNNTDSNGNFHLEAEATPGGVEYELLVSQDDNFWWAEKAVKTKLFSGRSTVLDLAITRRPTGKVAGIVHLVPAKDAPEIVPDWSGITVSIEDTPIKFTTDSAGNFDAVVAAGVFNITAEKENFKPHRIEYVTVLAGTTELVEFTLVEAWSVKVNPKHQTVDVAPTTSVLAEFDEPVKVSSVGPGSFMLLDYDDEVISGLTDECYKFTKDNKSCRLIPPGGLEYKSTYQVKLMTDILTADGSPILHRNWLSTFDTEHGLGSVIGYCGYYWTKLPIEHVNISLVNQPEHTTVSNEDGFYVLENIFTGSYQLRFSLKDFDDQIYPLVITPEKVTWLNITFPDSLPVPSLWAKNHQDRKVKITTNITDQIKVDTNFTLTSEIPLNISTITSKSIKIIEKSSGALVEYGKVVQTNNNLNFILDPILDLKFDTIYQVYFGRTMRTIDNRELFWKDQFYGEFKTEPLAWRPMDTPLIDPPNNAVNVPLDALVIIEFPVPMNRTSVEYSINTTFNILDFNWSNFDMTLILEHQTFEHFKLYSISLGPVMVSENRQYRLDRYINTSFTTITGVVKYIFGPIIDSADKPVDGASLVLFDSAGEQLRSAVTNSSGYATFYFESSLAPGNYTIKAKAKDVMG